MNVYIVQDGEFEISKKIKPEIEDDTNLTNYLGPKVHSPNQKKSDRSIQFHLTKNENIQSQRISIIGCGNMIGEEDAVAIRNYTTTVKCIS